MNRKRITAGLCSAVSALLLAGCGGGNSTSATLSGTVTGLATGTTVALINGTTTLNVGNGSFVFPGTLSSQDAYNVTVSTQPTGQSCLVANGSGVIDFAGDSIQNVSVSCAANLSVGGTVTHLAAGASLTLQNNFGTPYTVSLNGMYAFPELLTLGALYNVTIKTQPVGQVCTIATGTGSGGIVSLAPITNVNINCQ